MIKRRRTGRKAKRKEARPALAPLDSLGREIQQVLDLVKPRFGEKPKPKYDGYCGAASEAYLHLARERDGWQRTDLRVMRDEMDGYSHWWLMDAESRVIDLTRAPADRGWEKAHRKDCYRYEKGRGASFRNQPRPSKRAAAIIALVKAQRGS